MPLYFNRQGEPITAREWMREVEHVDRRVAHDVLPDGKVVSTVWLGIDHRFGEEGLPLIFKSMVFPSERNFSELDVRRYSTEEEARKGHAELVAEWRRRS